jgi:hypothetical protein
MEITSAKTAANETREPGLPRRQKFKSCKSFIFLPRPLGDIRLRIYFVMLSETFWYSCTLVFAPVLVSL